MLISLLVISLLSATSSNNLVAASSLRGLVPKTAVEKRTPQESPVSFARALAGKTVVCHHPPGHGGGKHQTLHLGTKDVESYLENHPRDFEGFCSKEDQVAILDDHDLIFGSGNGINDDFSVVREPFKGSTVELALRAKAWDFDKNIIEGSRTNNEGVFTIRTTDNPEKWNFDFSVNSDTDCSSGDKGCHPLSGLTYLLELYHPNYPDPVAFDPVIPGTDCAPVTPDNALGFIDTGEDTSSSIRCNEDLDIFGWKPSGCNSVYGPTLNENYQNLNNIDAYCTLYKDYLDTMTVAQNSWGYRFFTLPEIEAGTHTIKLSAIHNKNIIAQVAIDVEVTTGT
mmetsp:Transcript_29398/g.68860  ORF Transcript_29398/g.68860 Transcript_29398/m.68860 type:complete len:339 (+) Transcript_29398:68-1084(+)|eukprot:CAMPEP_0185800908 /NCGR_PEP_ID=MMETSP1322-20130828/1141_1 /TAXON_ID=265543 /ORGANISM="Minutocellus polymorphus, Strain RCC2270" /LENGTH=338 /DNA_ID=CAMNT_0028496573 /DNA_START=65 /DNA_END=1081 /DNA_ORIENTATION=+